MVRLRWLVPVLALAVAGCGSGASAPGSAAGSAVGTSGVAASSDAAAVSGTSGTSGSSGSKVQVTVPGLDGAAPAAPSSDAEDGVASEASAPAPTTGDAAATTVDVQLVGCDDCVVLGTHGDVVAGFSAALISQGGRAAVISIDGAGTVAQIMAVPYGTTFAAQPGGLLACGAGGRCLVVAANADGHAVLSAFELGADGGWTDRSGSGGFVSSTAKGVVVPLEDALGAAVQVTAGTTTVWNVLAWDGSTFATLGCGPDADTPDLAALDLANCLS